MFVEIKIGEIIPLDREFRVTATVRRDGYQYICLITEDAPQEIRFGKVVPLEASMDIEIPERPEKQRALLSLFSGDAPDQT